MHNGSDQTDDSCISSIMRVKTHHDSLRSIFGEDKSSYDSDENISSSDLSKLSVTNSSVKFDAIQIREYDIIIGDNPSCSEGVPLSLDWYYTEYKHSFDIEDYERMRGTRRVSAEMRIPTEIRHDILMEEWDYSLASIVRANNDIDVVRKQRMDTLIKEQKSIRIDDSRKKTKEHIRKLFGLNRRSSSL